MKRMYGLRYLLLPTLLVAGLAGACGDNPVSAENLGTIEVHNTAEAPVSAWRYSLCGQTQVFEVAINGPGGVIPQGFYASIEEFGGTCTHHSFELTNGRSIQMNNVVAVAQSKVTVTLTPP
jgi:hypothetical protein